MLLKRHWIWACSGLILGLIIGYEFRLGVVPAGILLACLFFYLYINRDLTYFQMGGIFFALGLFAYSLNPYPLKGDEVFKFILELKPNSYIEVEGLVTDTTLPNDRDSFSFILRVNRIRNLGGEWEQKNGKILVCVYQATKPVFVHQTVKVFGKSSLYLSPTNFNITGYEDYLRAHRIYARIDTRESNIQVKGTWFISPLYWLSRLRYSISKSLAKIAPLEMQGIIKALWLGDKTDLDAEEKEYFTLSGTAHILAISGLHIGIIFLIFSYAMGLVSKENHVINSVIALIMCAVYSVLSGLHGSSMRALVMISIGTMYLLTNRRIDLLSILAGTAIAILAFSPDYLWDIGTQMSICSVLSILIFYEPLRKLLMKLSMPALLVKHLALVLATQILLIPFLTIISNRINLLFPLTNLIVIPLVGLFLTTSVICFPFVFFPVISTPILYVSSFFLYSSQAMCKWSASQSWAIINMPSLSYVGLLFYLLSCYLLHKFLRNISNRNLIYFLTSVGVLILMWSFPHSRDELEVNLLDVSHGDSILISINRGENVLIDGGREEMGKKVVAPFLRSKGIYKIHTVVATHSDEDHIGGLSEVLKCFRVGEFLYGEGFELSSKAKELLSLASSLGITSRKLDKGEIVNFRNGAVLKILHTGAPPFENANLNSIVAKLNYKNFSLLLTGDFPADRAVSVFNRSDIECVVLKLPHHGLKNSLSDDFLNIVNPQLVVSSGNEFYKGWGVRPEVKQILEERNIPLLRTDASGGIMIKVNGDSYTVKGARQIRGYEIIKPRKTSNLQKDTYF